MYEYDRETGIPTNTETGARLRYLRGEGRMGDYRQFFLFEKPDLQFEVKIKSEHGERQVDQLMPEPRVLSWEDRKAFSAKQNAFRVELNYFHSEIEEVATRKPLGLDLAEDMMRFFQVRCFFWTGALGSVKGETMHRRVPKQAPERELKNAGKIPDLGLRRQFQSRRKMGPIECVGCAFMRTFHTYAPPVTTPLPTSRTLARAT